MAPRSTTPADDETPRETLTDVGDLAADLLAQLEKPVHTWRPDLGDATAVGGEIVSVSVLNGTFGPYPLIAVDDGRTIWRIHALGTVFLREIGWSVIGKGAEAIFRTNLAVGDMFAVQDTGERVSGKSDMAQRNPYRMVRIAHRPRGGAPIVAGAAASVETEHAEPSPDSYTDDIPF